MGSISPFCSIQGHIEQSTPKITYEQIEKTGSIEINVSQQYNDLYTPNKVRKQAIRQIGKLPRGVSDVPNLKQKKATQSARRAVSKDHNFTLVGEVQNNAALVKNEKLEERGNGTTENSLREEKDDMMVKSIVVVGISEVDKGINGEDGVHVHQHCMSLLRKYGIIKEQNHCISSKCRECAQNPGCVGDGSQPKICKICGQLEDANKTVICDVCEEVFHLSCCQPPLSTNYFLKEEYWLCCPCKNQKRQTHSGKHHMKTRSSGVIASTLEKKPEKRHIAKVVRVGPAYQADVPLWTGSAQRNQHFCSVDCPGSENPFSQEQKQNEKDEILKRFKESVCSASKLLPNGALENWIQCEATIRAEYKDCHGHKHAKVICGKWRRVPLGFDDSGDKEWECFNGMQWDPMRADCAVPQELPTEEVMARIQWKVGDKTCGESQVNNAASEKKQVGDPASEVKAKSQVGKRRRS